MNYLMQIVGFMDFDTEATTKKGAPGADLTHDEVSREMRENLERQMEEENMEESGLQEVEGSLAKPSAHPSLQGSHPNIQEMEGAQVDPMAQT